MIHVNATVHPNAAWTLQQLRFIIHDRDAIFSSEFDASVSGLDLEVITDFDTVKRPTLILKNGPPATKRSILLKRQEAWDGEESEGG
ncbi:MAG: hypothetical protein ABSC63_20080, partial [Candidatus Binataceae bacterium]